MNGDFFQELFRVLPEDNAEELWLEMIKEYLSSGGDISATNPSNGWGFLHYASENLFFDVVQMLLEYGMEVDSKSINGSTPYLVALDASIDAAIQENESEIDFSVVKSLVQHGANTDICSKDGISRESLLDAYGEKAKAEYYEQFS